MMMQDIATLRGKLEAIEAELATGLGADAAGGLEMKAMRLSKMLMAMEERAAMFSERLEKLYTRLERMEDEEKRENILKKIANTEEKLASTLGDATVGSLVTVSESAPSSSPLEYTYEDADGNMVTMFIDPITGKPIQQDPDPVMEFEEPDTPEGLGVMVLMDEATGEPMIADALEPMVIAAGAVMMDPASGAPLILGDATPPPPPFKISDEVSVIIDPITGKPIEFIDTPDVL